MPLPLYIRPQATFGATQGRVSIVCGTKPAFEKPVESVSLEVRLPGRVTSADPSATHGGATYDDMGHHVKWVIDKFPSDKTPCLTIQLSLEDHAASSLRGGPKGHPKAKGAGGGEDRAVRLQELVDIHANFSVSGVGMSGHQGGDAAGAQREVQAQPGRAVPHQGGGGSSSGRRQRECVFIGALPSIRSCLANYR